MPTKIHEPKLTLAEDRLGRRNDVAQFLKRLADPACAPVIGLYGTWGTGKTSFLNMVKSYYEQEWYRQKPEQALSLSFAYVDAWRYEQTGNLTVPVMAGLRRMLPNKSEPADFIRRLATVTLVTGLSLTADWAVRGATGGMLKLEDVSAQLEHYQKQEADRLKLVDLVDEAQAAFGQAVAEVCQAKECDRIVFLIDNLDRCFPDKVVALLESIKNVFVAPDPKSGLILDQCVWVLAIDPDVVARYINSKYPGLSMDGYSYLDKIVPEQYHLPFPLLQCESYSLAEFLNAQLGPDQRTGLPVDKERILLQLPQTLIPRRLIKVVRKYAEIQEYPSDYAFELILLYYCWPAFYRWLSVNSAPYIQGVLANFVHPELLEKLKQTEEFVALPPELAEDRELRLFVRDAFLSAEALRLAGSGEAADWYKRCQPVAEKIRQTLITQLRAVGLP